MTSSETRADSAGGGRSAPVGILRRACPADKNALVEVCRRSFRASLRWRCVPRAARQWWQYVLATGAAETYVFASDKEVKGFCVLITDAQLWARESQSRRMPLLSTLLVAPLHPTVMGAKILRRFAVASGRANPRAVAAARKWPRPRSWIELIAVDPTMRGRGVARMLLLACEARTVELGGAVIGLSVDADNDAAIRLYEAEGYSIASVTASRRVYRKSLSSPGGPNTGSSGCRNDLSSDCGHSA